jgi:hypothetical protein
MVGEDAGRAVYGTIEVEVVTAGNVEATFSGRACLSRKTTDTRSECGVSSAKDWQNPADLYFRSGILNGTRSQLRAVGPDLNEREFDGVASGLTTLWER